MFNVEYLTIVGDLLLPNQTHRPSLAGLVSYQDIGASQPPPVRLTTNPSASPQPPPPELASTPLSNCHALLSPTFDLVHDTHMPPNYFLALSHALCTPLQCTCTTGCFFGLRPNTVSNLASNASFSCALNSPWYLCC